MEPLLPPKKAVSRAKLVAAVAGASALAACVGLVATPAANKTVLSPIYTASTRPTLQWNGLPENYKFDPFKDSEHDDEYYTKDNKDAFGPKGQYGMWMGIQGDTINGFGCGPKGPSDCSVGTSPEQHWARRNVAGAMKQQQLAAVPTTKLSPVYSPNTRPDLMWNGLPEHYKNDLFRDSEHEDDRYTKDNLDPFGPKGQYGMWMGIQGDTNNSFGCGPNGPMDCSVGTTPGEHWIRRPNVQRKEGQKLRVNVAKGSNLQMTMQGAQGMQGMQIVDIPDAQALQMGLLRK